MEKRRDLFPVTKNLVYFNHAAVGPLSTIASEAMERFVRDQRDFGALHWRDWYAEYEKLRASAATLIGAADAHEIAIAKNTSEGLSFVAEGYKWREGENVVTTALEFPSNYAPWKRLERRGVECRVVADPSVEAIERAIDDRTRIVTVSSVAFHNGHTADLDAVGDLCKRRNLLFCVDAIQSVGALPMDVRRSNIAFLAADGHKWMCASEGAALFYVAAEHRERLEVLESGWTNIERRGKFLGTSVDLVPDSRRFEPGSLNTSGIYGLRAAIDLLLGIGIEEIGREVIRIATRLADGLESIGFEVRTPRPIRSGIIGAAVSDGRELLRLHGELEKEGIVCAPREGMLRFSPHFYNEESEVDRLLDVLSRLRRGSNEGRAT
jgi:cysteine desulfurase / selenocysteine lyase